MRGQHYSLNNSETWCVFVPYLPPKRSQLYHLCMLETPSCGRAIIQGKYQIFHRNLSPQLAQPQTSVHSTQRTLSPTVKKCILIPSRLSNDLQRLVTSDCLTLNHCIQDNFGLGQISGCAFDEHILGLQRNSRVRSVNYWRQRQYSSATTIVNYTIRLVNIVRGPKKW